jgi:DNA repair protein RadC
MKTIASLPPSLRPREKLLKFGAATLTIEELLSVILLTGSKSKPVSQLANAAATILKHKKSDTHNQLQSMLGASKAAQVVAAIELSGRLATKPITISSPQQIYLQSQDIAKSDKESLLCFFLNASGEILKRELVALGSVNQAGLLPRELYCHIKELPVASLILVHNHPSGNLDPSPADIAFTKRMQLAGDILGVKLQDHLIIGPSGWKRIPL